MESCFTPRQKKILEILDLQENWVKGGELASLLGVTARTVRNDIRDIIKRLEGGEVQLESSTLYGYRLCGKFPSSGLPQPAGLAPDLPEERLGFILKELLRSKERQSIYDLAEILAVSDSTIENDLKRVRLYLKEHAEGMVLVRKGEYVALSGGERAQRTLFSQLLFMEADGDFFGLSTYEGYFPKIKKIQQILFACLEKYSYELNELALVNIIVHIAIMIERMQTMHFLRHASSFAQYTEAMEYKIAQDLCDAFTEHFSISLPPQERLYLMYLLRTKRQARQSCRTVMELADFVLPENAATAAFMIEGVKREFGLDLSEDENFMVGFTLHVNALHERVKQRGVIRNPLLGDLKRRYPFVFEIAVFMADCFKKRTGIMIVEDEIGFITLHLGAALERLKEQTVVPKRVVLVCPSGSTSTEILLEKLRQTYQNKIEIAGIYSFFALDQIKAAKPDFIFATVRFKHDLPIPTIVISPFLDFRDIDLINKKLNLWENKVKKQGLQADMRQYFSEECFFSNIKAADRFSLLGYMADLLAEKGYVPDAYKASVLERERISSTSFDHLIAIPHAVDMNAKRTVISVARFDKPVVWGDHKVLLVLLFAIRKGERKKLNDLYQFILQIIDRQEGVQYLAQAATCEEFKMRILNWTESGKP